MLRPELLGAPRFWVKAVLVPDLYPSARAQASWLVRGEVVLVLVIVALGLALRG